MARRVRRGVKARRVVRRFELWSVAKLALVFHLFCYALTVAVLVVLWNVAFKLGTITKLETFLSDFGFSDKVSKQDFRLHGDAIFRAGAMAGLGLVALNTLATVLLAFFYNGVSGLFGGVVVSVLEERPPLSPAERRAVSADGRGERLALPSGSVDPVAGKRLRRRVRRKREQAAEAAAKAEASAVLMASGPSLPAMRVRLGCARPRRFHRPYQLRRRNLRFRHRSPRQANPERSPVTATRARSRVPWSPSIVRLQAYGRKMRPQTRWAWFSGTPMQWSQREQFLREQFLREPPECRARLSSGPNADEGPNSSCTVVPSAGL